MSRGDRRRDRAGARSVSAAAWCGRDRPGHADGVAGDRARCPPCTAGAEACARARHHRRRSRGAPGRAAQQAPPAKLARRRSRRLARPHFAVRLRRAKRGAWRLVGTDMTAGNQAAMVRRISRRRASRTAAKLIFVSIEIAIASLGRCRLLGKKLYCNKLKKRSGYLRLAHSNGEAGSW
jgi:hypothetical protein